MKILCKSKITSILTTRPHRNASLTGKVFAVTVSGVVVAVMAALTTPTAKAGDWPQLLGPNRNGTAEGERLLDSWPNDGPKRLWSKPLGAGYAGVAIQSDRVIAFHRVGNSERVEAFSADGRPVWKQDYPAHYRGGINSDKGPRCTPVIANGQVFAFGAAGDLYCLALADGKKLWTRNLLEDHPAPDSYFGTGSTPVVSQGHVLVNLGARGAGLIALDHKTGETVWKRTDEAASYSSPIQLNTGNNNVLFITRYNAVCVRPKDGKEIFRFQFGKRGPTVNAATPLFDDGLLFLTASYGIGAHAYQIKNDTASRVWSGDDAMSSQFATPVFFEGHLFGCHGREDIGPASFRCVDAKTGNVKWSEDGYGVAHVIRAGKMLLIQTTDGRIELLRANTARFERLAKAQVAEGSTKAIPAVSNGRLFVRQNSDARRGAEGKLICLQVGKLD